MKIKPGPTILKIMSTRKAEFKSFYVSLKLLKIFKQPQVAFNRKMIAESEKWP